MTIECHGWSHDYTLDQWLKRFNIRITYGDRTKPGYRLVRMTEQFGKAQLFATVSPAGRHPMYWKAGEPTGVIPNMYTEADGVFSVAVKNWPPDQSSGYQPLKGETGPHSIGPLENGDIIEGWGLAFGLPDIPDGETQANNYNTFSAEWVYDPGTPTPLPTPAPTPEPAPAPPYWKLQLRVIADTLDVCAQQLRALAQ